MKTFLTLCTLCACPINVIRDFSFKKFLLDIQSSSEDLSQLNSNLVISFSLTEEVREMFIQDVKGKAVSPEIRVSGARELLAIFLEGGANVENLTLSCIKPSKSIYLLAEFSTSKVKKAVVKVLVSDELLLSHIYPERLMKNELLRKLFNFVKELWNCAYGG